MFKAQQQIKSSLSDVGYSSNMFLRNVNFVKTGGGTHKTDLVAYSNHIRKDSDTAVIAIKRFDNVEKLTFEDIKPFRSIATPIIIFYESKPNKNYSEPLLRTVGLSKNNATFKDRVLRQKPIPISSFSNFVKDNHTTFSPRRLESVKWGAEQLSLFDVTPDLLGQAFRIINNELITHFQNGVNEVLTKSSYLNPKRIIEYAIKFLGARILRDKKKLDWSLSDLNEFLSDANQYLPDYFSIPANNIGCIKPLFKRLHSGYDLSQVSIDMVGEIYETFYVDDKTREKAGIHYTQSRLASTLLNRIPVEEIEPNKRILWDPTCGSGSLLAAGYERLTKAQYLNASPNKRHQELVSKIYGNDKDQIATMIAKMTLMLFHPPHKNNWKLTNIDIERQDLRKTSLNALGKNPSIIVANPPFGGIGTQSDQYNVKRSKAQRDRSAFILSKCLNQLTDGGLMGIILTETILDQKNEREIRNSILKNSEILDQWTIPPHWFPGVNRNALAWIIRKQQPKKSFAVILPWSDVPIVGQKPKLKGVLKLDIDNPPTSFVSSFFIDILIKIENKKNSIGKFFTIKNGFRHPQLLTTEKTEGAYPYSGNAKGTDPFTDIRNKNRGWVNLAPADEQDNNFDSKNQRKQLRKIIEKNPPSVLFRNARNTHGSSNNIHWSSIALIDLPENGEKCVAPSESFHSVFPKEDNRETQNIFACALWAILNHPVASFYIHEKQNIQWVRVETLRNFPLPNKWDLGTAKILSKLSTNLIEESRRINIGYNKNIIDILTKLDDLIYELYEISKEDRHKIESNLQFSSRPGICKIVENYHSNNIIQADRLIILYDDDIKKTTFEVLDIDYNKQKILLAIDGIKEFPEGKNPATDGMWFNFTPLMPGWLYKIGKVGWVELTTGIYSKLINQPECYIIDFKPFKNAFISHDDINHELMVLMDNKEA